MYKTEIFKNFWILKNDISRASFEKNKIRSIDFEVNQYAMKL